MASIKAQTPVAIRVKAIIKTLPSSAVIVAKYTDNDRHSLYYILNQRLYIYDVLENRNTELTFTEKEYRDISKSFISPDGHEVFIVTTDINNIDHNNNNDNTLWKINSKNKKAIKLYQGEEIIKTKKNILIKRRIQSAENKQIIKQTVILDLHGNYLGQSTQNK